MKPRHSSYHWILAALVAIAFLLTLSEAHGQSGVAAMVNGWLASAQGGIGAPGDEAAVAGTDRKTDKKTVRKSKSAEVKPKRDPGLAKDQQSATGKVKRAVRNTISRARHGVSPVDSGAEQSAGRAS
jgi:hypothetical protein